MARLGFHVRISWGVLEATRSKKKYITSNLHYLHYALQVGTKYPSEKLTNPGISPEHPQPPAWSQ